VLQVEWAAAVVVVGVLATGEAVEEAVAAEEGVGDVAVEIDLSNSIVK
jgi:hypothetical protein